MAHAIRVHQYGGPEVMKYEAVEVGKPGAGQVKLKQHAVGLNYIDIYHRTGLYPLPSLPFILGMEGAGEVTEVGAGVTEFKVGDRVAYAGPTGAYADERLIAAERLVKMPDVDRLQDRRRDDAAGHDRALPAAPHLQGRPGDDDAVPRRRRRRRPHRLPMGEAPRRHHHRHRRLRREVRARQGRRRHARHQSTATRTSSSG